MADAPAISDLTVPDLQQERSAGLRALDLNKRQPPFVASYNL
jgi:hypothetical protein